MNKHIINLSLRLVVGLNFALAAIAQLNIWKFYTESPAKIVSWITHIPVFDHFITIGLLITGIALIIGIKTKAMTRTGIGLILLNHSLLLFTMPFNSPIDGPFYNTFYHSVPFLGFLLCLYCAIPYNRLSLDYYWATKSIIIPDKNELIVLASRLFVGMIFLAQGFNIFTTKSFIKFAERNYVDNFASTILPQSLLWVMGILNPFILLSGGLALLIGFRIKWAAYLLVCFLITISFGHLFQDPFETSGSISMYGFNNLFFILTVLWFENGNNKYSVDYKKRSYKSLLLKFEHKKTFNTEGFFYYL